MNPDLTKLDKDEMAEEMFDALLRHGVPVNDGREGWYKLLRGISEGIILHLDKHDQALTIPPATVLLDTNHDHGGHVVVRR